jgi:uncharacterized protein involved in exopolysaccharide biosynthesis
MSEAQIFDKKAEVGSRNSSFDLIELAIIFAKRKFLLAGIPVVAAVLSAVLISFVPPTFQASTRLLPPQQAQSGAAALLSQLGGMAGAAAGVAGLKNPTDLYIGMLKSRTVADGVINRLNLKKAYKSDSMETVRKKLALSTNITAGKDGLILIEAEDRDQKLVAPLANAYAAELVRLTATLAVTEASQRRVFFERQMEAAKDNLASSEQALKRALDTHGVISVDADSRAIMETVGRLRAQVSAKEIELNSMRAFVTVNNPAFIRVNEELTSLRAELSKLENGRPGTPISAGTENGQQTGLENIKTLREVKYRQMLYELLAKQYEIARLDEAKDPAVIQVLDSAIEPERKSKPNRKLVVIISTLVGFVIAVAWILIAEARRRFLPPRGTSARIDELRSHLSGKRSVQRD